MNRKAVSSTISIILLILVAVVAPILIFQFVVPTAGKGLNVGSACIDPRIIINEKGGYTCYDSASRTINLQVKRGPGDYQLAGLITFVTIEGRSERFDITSDLLSANEERVYSVALNSSVTGNPQYVSIAPIIRKQDTQITCGITSRVQLQGCL